MPDLRSFPNRRKKTVALAGLSVVNRVVTASEDTSGPERLNTV
jgi:hypothetical protein